VAEFATKKDRLVDEFKAKEGHPSDLSISTAMFAIECVVFTIYFLVALDGFE
jgi:hypothetical protein